MDYEKKYKEALELARDYYEDKNCFEYLKSIFPELKKSEDKEIKGAIIDYLKDSNLTGWAMWLEKQESVGEIVARCKTSWYNEGKIQGQIEGLTNDEKYQQGWHDALEKQSEQKSANYVESKFEVGAWITFWSKPFKILKVESEQNGILDYLLLDQNGHDTYYNKKYFDENARLWTIADAKDGDILICVEDNAPFIFKGCLDKFHPENPVAYCGIDYQGGFFVSINNSWWTDNDVCPATKEQRDYLFEKMEEAGYEWDDEKKELRKIEQSELTEFEDAVKDMMNAYRDAIGDNDATTEEIKKHASYMLSLISNKPAEWTDEDERYMGECISAIATKDSWSFEEKRRAKHWLQSIKQRIEE